MSAPPHDLAHLLASIEAARAHAERLGPLARRVAALLEEAALTARSLQAHGGRPDEGLRPEQLTTENDE